MTSRTASAWLRRSGSTSPRSSCPSDTRRARGAGPSRRSCERGSVVAGTVVPAAGARAAVAAAVVAGLDALAAVVSGLDLARAAAVLTGLGLAAAAVVVTGRHGLAAVVARLGLARAAARGPGGPGPGLLAADG